MGLTGGGGGYHFSLALWPRKQIADSNCKSRDGAQSLSAAAALMSKRFRPLEKAVAVSWILKILQPLLGRPLASFAAAASLAIPHRASFTRSHLPTECTLDPGTSISCGHFSHNAGRPLFRSYFFGACFMRRSPGTIRASPKLHSAENLANGPCPKLQQTQNMCAYLWGLADMGTRVIFAASSDSSKPSEPAAPSCSQRDADTRSWHRNDGAKVGIPIGISL